MKLVNICHGSSARMLDKAYTANGQSVTSLTMTSWAYAHPNVITTLNSIALFCDPPCCAAWSAVTTDAASMYTMKMLSVTIVNMYLNFALCYSLVRSRRKGRLRLYSRSTHP